MNIRNYGTGNTSSSKNAVIGKNNSVMAHARMRPWREVIAMIQTMSLRAHV